MRHLIRLLTLFLATLVAAPGAMAQQGATVRSVWDQFRSRGLSHGKAKSLLSEWEAQGLLGAQPSVTQARPVLREMKIRLGREAEDA